MRRVIATLCVCLLAVAIGGVLIPRVQAQDTLCFPETGNCLSGRFRAFWEQNGGLAVFGYPISMPFEQGGRMVQYFERQRFELHPENQPPYDVLLGRLGDEALRQRGIDWQTLPRAAGPAAGCRYFAETQHNVCDQGAGAGFLSYWDTHGLEIDGQPGKSFQESLALFGYPIGEPAEFTSSSGEIFQAQSFERARFEWHPNNPEPFKVLLGRLGAELQPAASPAEQAYDNPSSPVDLLASYYNAIDRQEYQRAYGYWQTPPSGYDEFARGYAQTIAVELIVRPPWFIEGAAGSLYAAIPTVLIAHQSDGTQTFAGCYTVRKSNLRQPDIPQRGAWNLYQATIAPAASGASIPDLLRQACANVAGVDEKAAPPYDNPNSPVDLLASYYNAIDRQEYQRAYGYWQNPPSTYDTFVQGYKDTASVLLIVRPPATIGVAAGNAYAQVPTVLVANRADGSTQTFAGCYTLHKVNLQPPDIPRPDVWHIYQATIAPVTSGESIPQLLAQGCPSN
jgi:hypothetical protein